MNKKLFFRENLRTLRLSADLTQEQLAERLELKRSVVTSYERGKTSPPLTNLLRIADFFELSLEALLFENLRKQGKSTTAAEEQESSENLCLSLEIDFLRKEIAYRDEILRLKTELKKNNTP